MPPPPPPRALNISNFPFPRSILTLWHRFFVKFQHCVPPPQRAKISKCKDEYSDDFLPWLENKAGVQISSLLSIGVSEFGRSLFACKSVQAGDCLLKVPFSVQISPDNVLPDFKPLLSDAVGTAAKLAVVVLVEQKKGQNSKPSLCFRSLLFGTQPLWFHRASAALVPCYPSVGGILMLAMVFIFLSSEWAPYISHLPQLGELHSTIFWSEKELEMIQLSSVYQETMDQEARIRQDYVAVKPVFDLFPGIFEDVKFENFKHAYGLVASRAWESMKGQSLIPFADFLNHDGTSESVVLCDVKEQVSEVIADRDYVPGEEVLIRYGKFSNSSLLLDFGFTVPCNKYDQVVIQVDIPYNDHLRALKLDILQKHCLPQAKDANFTSSGASFVIKEVRSVEGKGKGIPQSLRAFARILCCTSSQELNELDVEAAQHDGRLARRPLVNWSLEIRAHEIFLSIIDELIVKYNVTIESLQMLESSNCGKFALRQQMAHDLLTGEVRVLMSASAWLEKYCQSYPGEGKPS